MHIIYNPTYISSSLYLILQNSNTTPTYYYKLVCLLKFSCACFSVDYIYIIYILYIKYYSRSIVAYFLFTTLILCDFSAMYVIYYVIILNNYFIIFYVICHVRCRSNNAISHSVRADTYVYIILSTSHVYNIYVIGLNILLLNSWLVN